MPDEHDEIIDELPGVLREIAEATSVAVALKVAHAFGGTEIYIPAKAGPKTPLVKAIGMADATEIIERFGYGELLIPLGPTSDFSRKRRAIIALLDEGRSAPEIARRLKCHRRTVIRVRNHRPDPRQLDLLGRP